MSKPTGRPVGRPKTKEYKTLLARVPQDLVDRVQHYAGMHRSTIAELIRDGLEWRITEGDPYGGMMYYTNKNGYSSNTGIETAGQSADFQLPGMLDAQEEEDAVPVVLPQTAQPVASVAHSPTALPDRAAVLAQLHAWQAEGLSLQTMVDRLNASGVPTFRGKLGWSRGTIGNLLTRRQAQPA